MKGKQALSLVLTLALALALTACGGAASSVAAASPAPSVPKAAASLPGGPVTVTDQAGREVTIEGDVERIVSCYYISSSACIALGLKDRMVGIEAKAGERPIYQMAAPELMQLPSVGSAREFNMEACIELAPDLVLLPKRLQDNAETMAGLGIPVLLVSPESHEDLVEMIRLIGAATGTRQAADALIAYYSTELQAIADLAAGTETRPSVYMGGNSSYLSTAPTGMYQATLIEAAGGANAAADIEGDNWTDVSYEQLLEMNPDVILIPAEASYTRDELIADPQLAGLTAVAGGAVYQMPSDFEAWDSPVPSCVLGIKWALAVLHPEVYTMEEMRQDAAAFYAEFYGAEIDTALIG